MAVTVRWESPKLVVSRYSGRLLPDDIVDAHTAMMQEKRKQAFSWLNLVEADTDLNDLTIDVYRDKFVPEVFRFEEERKQLLKTVWVVAPSQTLVMKLWQEVAPEVDSRAFAYFTDEGAAREWLSAQ